MESGERKNSMRLLDPSSGQPLADSQLLWTDHNYGRSDLVLSTAGNGANRKTNIYTDLFFCRVVCRK